MRNMLVTKLDLADLGNSFTRVRAAVDSDMD